MAAFPLICRRALLTGVAALALVPGVVLPLPATAQDDRVPATADVVPADAVFYLTFDLDPGSPQWQQAQALLGRVGLPNALDEARTALLEHPANAGSARLSEADLDALLGGEMAIVALPRAVENLRDLAEAAITAAESAGMATPLADEAVEAAMAEALATPLADIADAGFGVAALLEPGDIDGAWAYVERQMAQAAAEAGTTVEQVDYNGTTILVAPVAQFYGGVMDEDGEQAGMATDENPSPAKPAGTDDGDGGEDAEDGAAADTGAMEDGPKLGGEIATARVGDVIVTAGTAADLEPFIDAAGGSGDTLADAAELQSLRAEFANDDLLFTYFSFPQLRAGLGDELADRLDDLTAAYAPGYDPTPYWEAHLGAVVWADAPGFRVDTVIARTDGQPLPAFYDGVAPPDFAQRVPADSVVYHAGTISRPELDSLAISLAVQVAAAARGGMTEPQSLEDALALFDEEYVQEQLDQAAQILGFDLKTGFTDLLAGRFGFAAGLPQISGPSIGLDLVFAAATNDPAGLAGSVEQIARLIESTTGETVTARRDGTDTVYLIGDPQATGIPTFEFGVVGDELQAGTESGLAEYRGRVADPLAADPQFQRVMGLLPDDGYQEAYLNLGTIIEFVLAFSDVGLQTGGADADLSCTNYADQAEAQAALEDDPIANASLDLDFDGQACEDFFGAAASPVAAVGGPQAVRALGIVVWEREGKQGSNTLLFVEETPS